MTDDRERDGVPLPARIGVIGGGRMGAGIAHAFALTGAEVVVVERDDEAAAAASARVLDSLRRSVDRGTTSRSFDALAAAVQTATDAAYLAGCGLVVEAVPEDRALKVAALARAERVLDDAAIKWSHEMRNGAVDVSPGVAIRIVEHLVSTGRDSVVK